MKIKFLLFTVVACVIAFTSCKKDDPSSSPEPMPTPVPTASKQLRKITKTEANIVTVYNLTYNAANKLLSYKTADNSEYLAFSYDTEGNLTGIEQKDTSFKNIYNYTYQNNIPVTGTFKSWQIEAGEIGDLIEDDQLTYTVSNNKVTNIRLDMLQAGSSADLALSYTGENLTRVASEGLFSYTADFSFGTHPSAFPKVSNYVLDQEQQAIFQKIYSTAMTMTGMC